MWLVTPPPIRAHSRPMNKGQASPNIVLVDDTATYRLLLKETLRVAFASSELRDFATGEQAMAACLEQPPDLLITDLRLRSMDGRGLVRSLWEQGCRPRVVVLTAYPEAGLPGELLALGVAGFVDKSSPMEQVAHAAQCVWQGGMHFSATVPPPMPVWTDPVLPWVGVESLSEREREVVRLVVRGLLSKQIAAELGLSPRTVEKHRARICAKLGMHDVPTLVRWSLRNGLG
jgi:DNA-binding NarL/FixJ family response regulator